MKNAFLFLMMALPLLSISQDKEYVVKGKIANSNSGKVVIYYAYDKLPRVDSANLKNGEFRFRVKLTEPEAVTVSLLPPGVSSDEGSQDYIAFFLGDDIDLQSKGSLKDAQLRGPGVAFDSLYKLYISHLENVRKHSENEEELDKFFIAGNRNSYFSLAVLERQLDFASLKSSSAGIKKIERSFNEHLTPELRNTTKGKLLDKRIRGAKESVIGGQFIPFKQKGLDGKMVNLGSMKGQVFLIDFWGSWCGACRASHPHLKELYNKYRSKGFEIVAVGKEFGPIADQKEKWKKAIEKDQTPWLHILDQPSENNIVNTYSIYAYPTKILVDRDGTIVLKVTDDRERLLDKKLEELFQ